MRKIVGVLLHDMLDSSQNYEYIRALEESADRAGWLIMLATRAAALKKNSAIFASFVPSALAPLSSVVRESMMMSIVRILTASWKFVKAWRTRGCGRAARLPFTEFVPDNVGVRRPRSNISRARPSPHRNHHRTSRGHRHDDRLLGAKKAFERQRLRGMSRSSWKATHRRASGVSGCERLLLACSRHHCHFRDERRYGVWRLRGGNARPAIPIDLSVIGYDDVAIAHALAAANDCDYPTAELARLSRPTWRGALERCAVLKRVDRSKRRRSLAS